MVVYSIIGNGTYFLRARAMFVYMFILQCLYVNMTMMLARNVLLDQKISKHDYK